MEEQATFAPNIKREQEKIDWTNLGRKYITISAGSNPWPVAYTVLKGLTIKVWKSEKLTTSKQELPVTVIELQKDGIVVSTGNQTGIKITELQPAGKKRMTAQQFLQGTGTIGMGDVMGDKHENN